MAKGIPAVTGGAVAAGMAGWLLWLQMTHLSLSLRIQLSFRLFCIQALGK